jgi:hypothetical protein
MPDEHPRPPGFFSAADVQFPTPPLEMQRGPHVNRALWVVAAELRDWALKDPLGHGLVVVQRTRAVISVLTYLTPARCSVRFGAALNAFGSQNSRCRVNRSKKWSVLERTQRSHSPPRSNGTERSPIASG